MINKQKNKQNKILTLVELVNQHPILIVFKISKNVVCFQLKLIQRKKRYFNNRHDDSNQESLKCIYLMKS